MKRKVVPVVYEKSSPMQGTTIGTHTLSLTKRAQHAVRKSRSIPSTTLVPITPENFCVAHAAMTQNMIVPPAAPYRGRS